MTQHAPGPWIAEDEHRPNHETYQIHNGKQIVAHGVSANNMPIVRAAPDLLEALLACKVTLEAFLPEAWATIAVVNEAINKTKKV